MNCYIYKLNFTTPVHFGERSLADSTTTCRADTLFSAICISWMKAFGNIDDLIEGVNKDEFIYGSTFNEENYTEACRLIKKLFMGKSDE